jgi:4-hydroxybenzoate polyprenyltransferase
MAQLDGSRRTTPVLRPRWRAYLLLARVSNLPTVWSNVLAGSSGAVGLAATSVELRDIFGLGAAASLFYTGGMLLNDAFDAPHDRVARPERPIPRGDVGRGEAFAAGAVCLLLGELLLGAGLARWLGAALAAAIVVYDLSHKGNPVAPVVMGACRALVYAVAGVSAGEVPGGVIAGAVAMWVYVSGLTVVARLAGPNARWLVPLLIAGISLLDAAFIVIVAPALWPLAMVAALGFPLTLFLQRWVPGD